MKVGDTRSDEAIKLIAELDQYMRGEVHLKHPRHGRVEIRRSVDGQWRVMFVQRPDKETP